MGIVGSAKFGLIVVALFGGYLLFKRLGGAGGIGSSIGSSIGGGLNSFGTTLSDAFTKGLFGGDGDSNTFEFLPKAFGADDGKDKTGEFLEKEEKGNFGGFPNSRLVDTPSRTLIFQGKAETASRRGFLSPAVTRALAFSGGFDREIQSFQFRRVGGNTVKLVSPSGRSSIVSAGSAVRLQERGFTLG